MLCGIIKGFLVHDLAPFLFLSCSLARFFINAWPHRTNDRVLSLLKQVGARRWRNRGMGFTAHRRWCHLLTRTRLEPLQPVGPPTAIVLLSTFQPLVSILHRLVVDPVASALASWPDDTSNMAPAGQNKAHVATSQRVRAYGRLPKDTSSRS